MINPDSYGVLITCGIIIFLSACMMIRILYALEREDNKNKKDDDED